MSISSPLFQDSHTTIYNKDCRDMSELSDESIQCVVTSPPYWGLRKYSGNQDLIWGDNHCEHEWGESTFAIQGNNSMIRGKGEIDSGNFAIPKFKGTDMKQSKVKVGNICSLCGAWKGQLGLEPNIDMYVSHITEILREIRRVLRSDGVCFLNLGDSYSSGLTMFSKCFRIKETLNTEELEYVATELSKLLPNMWSGDTSGVKESEGTLPPVLYEGIQEELLDTPEDKNREEKSRGLLSCQQNGIRPQESREATETEVRSNRSLRGKMPMLRGNRAEISNDRPHKRRGRKGQGEISRDTGTTPPFKEAGMDERGLSPSLLELQRSIWTLGKLSSLRLNETNIPTHLITYFELIPNILKPKDLCLIPFRVAIAAQEAGWWVRSVIIWSKPNPMPESCRDRPTESHEYILMLTKSGTIQYWTHRDKAGTRQQPKPDYRWQRYGKPDIKAIAKEIGGMAQRTVWEERDGEDRGWREAAERRHSDIIEERDTPPEGWTPKNKGDWDRINLWRGHDYYWDAEAVREQYTAPLNRWGGDTLKRDTSKTAAYKEMQNIGNSSAFRVGRSMRPIETGRNLRSVWTFPTQPYKGAHFATYPEKLVETCIKAATPEVGCCAKCGTPWVRVINRTDIPKELLTKTTRPDDGLIHAGIRKDGIFHGSGQTMQNWRDEHPNQTLGWRPTCDCYAEAAPSTVLDPFAGSGTTLWVAKKLGRQAIGYDISEEYCQLALERNKQSILNILGG